MAEPDYAQLLPPPNAFLCPITQELMTDPVATADGMVYERNAIEMWFRTPKCGNRSPVTNEPLPSRTVSENRPLRKAIEEYRLHRPELIRREVDRAALEEIVRTFAEDFELKAATTESHREHLRQLQDQMSTELSRLQDEVMELQKIARELLESHPDAPKEPSPEALPSEPEPAHQQRETLESPPEQAAPSAVAAAAEPSPAHIEDVAEKVALPNQRSGAASSSQSRPASTYVRSDGACPLFLEAETLFWNCMADTTCALIVKKLKGKIDLHSKSFIAYLQVRGWGVPQNTKKGIEALHRGVEAGNSTAMCYLGICVEKGHGIQENPKRYFELVEQAAEQGNLTAVWMLGDCFREGLGVSKKLSAAVEFYQFSAEGGNTVGMCRMGRIYQEGLGVERDERRAAAYYQEAADKGHTESQRRLAKLYQRGDGVTKDLRKAFRLLEEATRRGDADAMPELAICYDEGLGVAENRSKAIELITKAALIGRW